MMRKFIFILIWLISLIITSIFTYENPEVIDYIKKSFEKRLPSNIKFEQGPSNRSAGNSFIVEFSQEVSFLKRVLFR